jgi:hypothetical protein
MARQRAPGYSTTDHIARIDNRGWRASGTAGVSSPLPDTSSWSLTGGSALHDSPRRLRAIRKRSASAASPARPGPGCPEGSHIIVTCHRSQLEILHASG